MPQDARAVDIISALSLLGFACQVAIFGNIGEQLLALRDWPFWVLSMTALSILQLVSVYLHPFAETLRAFVTGLVGLFWVYVFFIHCTTEGFLPLTLFVGIGCLYSAVITTLYIGQTWKS